MKRGALCAAFALVVAAGSPRSVRAQESEPDALSDEEKREQRKAEAKEHFALGDQLHRAGDYAGAAEAYRKSYKALPLPIMVYNIAQVLRLGGDPDGAIEHYERYLQLEPDGRGAASARQFLEELRRAKEAAEQTDVGTEESDTGEVDPQPESDPAPIAPDPTRDQPIDISGELDGGSDLRTAGLITAAAGVLAIGAAGVFAWRASAAESDLSDFEGEWGGAQADRYQSGRRMQRASLVLGITGAAAAATGVGLYLWGGPSDETRLGLGPTPGGATASMVGRF